MIFFFNIDEGPIGELLSWMELPYWALPEIGVTALVGEDFVIYGDSLINIPVDNELEVVYSCDIGYQIKNNYYISPVVSDIGNHTLQITFKNQKLQFLQESISINVQAKNIGSKSILMIGDSTLDEHLEVIGGEIDNVLDGTLTYLGLRGTTRKHEAHSGWSTHTFINSDDPLSPFRKAGELNIAAYFTDNSIATPDIIYIRMGINDYFAKTDDPTLNQVKANIKTLIDAFLAFDANLNIILALPTTCVNTTGRWALNYDPELQDVDIEGRHKLWNALTSIYANNLYDLRVNISYETINLDRNLGYLNGVHLTTYGYEQIGSALAFYLNKYF